MNSATVDWAGALYSSTSQDQISCGSVMESMTMRSEDELRRRQCEIEQLRVQRYARNVLAESKPKTAEICSYSEVVVARQKTEAMVYFFPRDSRAGLAAVVAKLKGAIGEDARRIRDFFDTNYPGLRFFDDEDEGEA